MFTILDIPVLDLNAPLPEDAGARTGRVYVETYGCAMNTSDSEIVLSVLKPHGYTVTDRPDDADVILINTCAIRDNAERRIHDRLKHMKFFKRKNRNLVVGVLGCMAERLRASLLDTQLVDIVVGPDEYRNVPSLIASAIEGERGIAVKLSRVETYADIVPLRTDGISAWVSIMRGCDKFCTFCVVPFTRGRERSRPLASVVDEVKGLFDRGFKEITLLGQNVNSYRDEAGGSDFSDLLAACARAVPQMRIRYSTSHPQDMSDKLIDTMAEHDEICKYVHLPVQSGSDRILELMNRTYSVTHYLERIERIRKVLPGVALSTDIISGFCSESEDDHQKTMELMRLVRYDGAYMYEYSPRENTKAWKMGDDVLQETKSRRLTEIIEMQRIIGEELNVLEVGKTLGVLVEGRSKRSASEWIGRTDTNKKVIFPHDGLAGYSVGDVVNVTIDRVNSATLFGSLIVG
ncbi:MAG: tRNA (N6-isopentenyl adenosine(37)-C2)-methylthiotransferase MiaB [bacterium]|nr:tRNA (N6-isopentenyl adenosine(37)-C2)-methylthiotransferase MiaB [bacterium]